MIKDQYLLFNESDKIINFIIDNNIMVYTNLDNIVITNDFTNLNFNLEDITWIYDENNYRIPYYNNTKINYIKLDPSHNIYDFISSNSIIPDEEIICGENIQYLCDVVLFTDETLYSNPNNHLFSKKIENIDKLDNLDQYNSIFVKSDQLHYFYNKFDKDINNKIIVSHNSDDEINEQYIKYLNKVNKQLSQNCLFQYKNLISLPIGIENRQWCDPSIFHHIRKSKHIKKTKNIYFFFSLDTNSSRKDCYDSLKDTLEWNQQKNKEDYFIELKKHKYALCPRGNGLD